MVQEFILSKQLPGHSGEVRCGSLLRNGKFVTGGFDATCNVWDLAKGNLERTIYGHSDFVYCVCPHPFNADWFLSGSKDRAVIIFDSISGEKISSLDTVNVHAGPVCSIASSGSLAVVGSWDGTISVWDLETTELVHHIQPAGAYAVSLAIDGDMIISGSQDKTLRFFKIGTWEEIKSVPNAHSDIIRYIAIGGPGIFVTASNDTSLKVWSHTCVTDVGLVGTLEGHENFVFSCDVSGGVIVSSSEDRTVRVWSLDDLSCVQIIKHPGTVWFSKVLDAQRIVTGSSDTFVRTFTLIPSEAAPQEEREAFASLSTEASADKEQVDPNTVPSESEMHRWPGKKVGDIKMFKDASNVVYAYQWTALRAWEKVGLVTGSGGAKKKLKKTYGGDQYFNPGEYEYIFDVELGEGRMALLPFNEGDNPLVTAEKFCAREGINKANISQIIDFIKSNTTGSSCAVSNTSPVTKNFPLTSPYLFKEAKWPQLLSKLHEVNSSLPEHSRLNSVEMNLIESVVELLQKPPSNTNPDLRPAEIQIVHSTLISRFPPESLFVVFDLWRMFVLNSAACVMYKDSHGGSQYMITAARYLEQNSTNNTGLCCARYLTNLFSQSVPKWAAVDNQKLFVSALVHTLSTPEGVSKNTQVACASGLANLASATTEKATAKSVELAQSLADSIISIIHSGIARFDAEVVGRLLIALGSCVVGARTGLAGRKHELQLLLQEVEKSGKSDPVIAQCISEIRQVI